MARGLLSFRPVPETDVELTPPQPPEVEAAVASLLAEAEVDAAPDPWWLEGVEASLNT